MTDDTQDGHPPQAPLPSGGEPSIYPAEFQELWTRVQPYTMTSIERGFALWSAVNHVIDQDLPGSFVECGVWKGGSAMLIALTLLQRGAANRELILFDTYAGMTEPGPQDVDIHGRPADSLMDGSHGAELAELVQAAISLEDVRAALASTGYDMRLIRFVEGDVRQTIPVTSTMHIALLRLDTDFYDSTLVELQHLYPRLVRGGPLIIDDYGHWSGAKQAVEEHFANPDQPCTRPMLWVIDYTGRGAIKVEDATDIEMERYDYIPEGMTPPDLMALFPDAAVESPWSVDWPYLRKHVPHIWRSDTRHDGYTTGNASVEEAACLFAFAQQFAGQRGLEIGTHFGWTAAHLLAAGLRLDCIDPALASTERHRQVTQALDGVPTTGSYRLWDGFSPHCIAEVNAGGDEPWSFVFIDGNHDGEAPREDALAVLPYLAADAVVMFHDLTSPHVEAGLAEMAAAGFQTRLLHTMQIMGVAWRGDVIVPDHERDPNIPYPFISHLDKYLGQNGSS